jgi:hypothetical protein
MRDPGLADWKKSQIEVKPSWVKSWKMDGMIGWIY